MRAVYRTAAAFKRQAGKLIPSRHTRAERALELMRQQGEAEDLAAE